MVEEKFWLKKRNPYLQFPTPNCNSQPLIAISAVAQPPQSYLTAVNTVTRVYGGKHTCLRR